MWAGPRKHFLVFPVRHGTMVNYVGFMPTDEEMKESWSAPGDPAVLRLYLQSLQLRDPQALWALLHQPPVSAMATQRSVQSVPPRASRAPATVEVV